MGVRIKTNRVTKRLDSTLIANDVIETKTLHTNEWT